MEDARRRIKRAIDRGDGPAIAVGAAGTGKSLLLQVLAANYHKRYDVVLLACARICTRRALLQSILFELGLSYRQRDEGQLRLSLLDHLLSDNQCPAGLLLLVDEAQSLSTTLLDELRVMTNLMRGGLPRVRVVLAGSAVLEESFADPELESFSQRLSARCYLSPLSREETSQFIRAQVAAAGLAPESVFAADAYDAVFEATDGIPRLVNQVCDRALLLGCDENGTMLDRQTIQSAWADLQQLPTTWSSPRESSAQVAATSQVIEFGSLADLPAETVEAADVDPTELDSDDNLSKATDIRPKSTPRAPRDPADPFAEQFDEEEVVLDNFAAWDEMFHARTPRVENHRDRHVSTLIHAALEPKPVITSRPIPPTNDRSDANVDDVDVDDDEAFDIVPPPDESTTVWPRLRLANVPESTGPEQSPGDDAYADVTPTRTWRDHSIRDESPILIVEDDTPPNRPGPPVRRLSYQNLFSRLRSG